MKKETVKNSIIVILVVVLLVLIPQKSKVIYIHEEPNISRPIIMDYGGCENGRCILIIYNNGTKKVMCRDILVYRDGHFYGHLNDFKDAYGQKCSYIQPKKYVRLVTPDLCNRTEKISIRTNFTDSLINDDHLYSEYVSSYLCIMNEYNKTKI